MLCLLTGVKLTCSSVIGGGVWLGRLSPMTMMTAVRFDMMIVTMKWMVSMTVVVTPSTVMLSLVRLLWCVYR